MRAHGDVIVVVVVQRHERAGGREARVEAVQQLRHGAQEGQPRVRRRHQRAQLLLPLLDLVEHGRTLRQRQRLRQVGQQHWRQGSVAVREARRRLRRRGGGSGGGVVGLVGAAVDGKVQQPPDARLVRGAEELASLASLALCTQSSVASA